MKKKQIGLWSRLVLWHKKDPRTVHTYLGFSALLLCVGLTTIAMTTFAMTDTAVMPVVTMALGSPTTGSTLSGSATLTAHVFGSEADNVVFVVDNDHSQQIQAVRTGSELWTGRWNTRDTSNGTHTITIQAAREKRMSLSDTFRVVVENPLPLLGIRITAPTQNALLDEKTIVMTAEASHGTESVTFILFDVFQPKIGPMQETELRRFSAIKDESSDTWTASVDPLTLTSLESNVFKIKAVAKQTGYADTMSPGTIFNVTIPESMAANPESTLTDAVVDDVGNPFLNVRLVSPKGGVSATGTVQLLANISPPNAVSVHFSIWNEQGYSAQIDGSLSGSDWQADWETGSIQTGSYWIQAIAFDPGEDVFISKPHRVLIQH